MRWKNQSNVFPQGEIIQEKSLDNSQPGLHRLAGKTDITLTLLRNVKNKTWKCSDKVPPMVGAHKCRPLACGPVY